MKATSFYAVALSLGLLLFLQGTAGAHAFVDHAEPKVGSLVHTAPDQVKIWLSQDIESNFSAIQVFDADGKQCDKKDSHVDAADKKLLIVGVSSLPAGTYKVVWHVVSVDTHRTHGDFKFTIKP